MNTYKPIESVPYFSMVKRNTYVITPNKEVYNIITHNKIMPTKKKDSVNIYYIKFITNDNNIKSFSIDELYYYHYLIIDDVKNDIEKVKQFKNTNNYHSTFSTLKSNIRITKDFIVDKFYQTTKEIMNETGLKKVELGNDKILFSKSNNCYFKRRSNENIGDYLPIRTSAGLSTIDSYKLSIYTKLISNDLISNTTQSNISNTTQSNTIDTNNNYKVNNHTNLITNESFDNILINKNITINNNELSDNELSNNKETLQNINEIDSVNIIDNKLNNKDKIINKPLDTYSNASDKFIFNTDRSKEPKLNNNIKLEENEQYQFINDVNNKITFNQYIITNHGRVFNNLTGNQLHGRVINKRHIEDIDLNNMELYVEFHKYIKQDDIDKTDKYNTRTNYRYQISKLVYFYFSSDHYIPKYKVIKRVYSFLNTDEKFNYYDNLKLEDIQRTNNQHKSIKASYNIIENDDKGISIISIDGYDSNFYRVSNINDNDLSHIFINKKGDAYNINTKNILHGNISKDGFRKYTLYSNNGKKKRDYFAHYLVGVVFNGYQNIPFEKQRNRFVNDHIDNDKLNNSSTNIQTLTARDNTAKEVGRKITKIVKKDGKFYVSNIYDSIAQAQRDNNISNIRISIKKPVQFSVTNNCWFRDYKNTDYIDQETQLY